VTCADKLRDRDKKWLKTALDQDAGDDVLLAVANEVMVALPEIAAVIEAAEQIIENDSAALLNNETAMAAMWDAVGDLHSTVAALSARLGDVPSQKDGAS